MHITGSRDLNLMNKVVRISPYAAAGKEAMYAATQTECGCRFTDYGKLTALERSSQNDVVPQVCGVFHYLKALCFFKFIRNYNIFFR